MMVLTYIRTIWRNRHTCVPINYCAIFACIHVILCIIEENRKTIPSIINTWVYTALYLYNMYIYIYTIGIKVHGVGRSISNDVHRRHHRRPYLRVYNNNIELLSKMGSHRCRAQPRVNCARECAPRTTLYCDRGGVRWL